MVGGRHLIMVETFLHWEMPPAHARHHKTFSRHVLQHISAGLPMMVSEGAPIHVHHRGATSTDTFQPALQDVSAGVPTLASLGRGLFPIEEGFLHQKMPPQFVLLAPLSAFPRYSHTPSGPTCRALIWIPPPPPHLALSPTKTTQCLFQTKLFCFTFLYWNLSAGHAGKPVLITDAFLKLPLSYTA